jgi:hypothetical protein
MLSSGALLKDGLESAHPRKSFKFKEILVADMVADEIFVAQRLLTGNDRLH